MKQNRLSRTFFGLQVVLLLMAACHVHAQTLGNNSVYPIPFTSIDTCSQHDTTSRTESWYRFNGAEPTITIKVRDFNTTAGSTTKVVLYQGVCTNLHPVDSLTRQPGDTLLILTKHHMPANQYFIKLTHTGGFTTYQACLKQDGDPGFCTFDKYLETNPGVTPLMTAQDQYIYNYIQTHSQIAGPFTIPVVVHVIHNGDAYGTGTNISLEQIQWQIAAMNAAFQKNYAQYNAQQHGQLYPSGFHDYAVNTQVRFCLARTGRDSALNQVPFFFNTMSQDTEFGVMRYDLTMPPFNTINNVTSLLEYDMRGIGDEQLLMNVTRPGTEFPASMYFNIYLVAEICQDSIECNNILSPSPSVVGFATMAPNISTGFDGSVMRSDAFGDNSVIGNSFPLFSQLTEGKIMAHEAGHYLALYHTFQPDSATQLGCYGMGGPTNPTDNCFLHGDFCCDTPPDATATVLACPTNINYDNSCNESYFVLNQNNHNDMIENYMDYRDDDCYNTFTFDQAMRTSAMLDIGGPRHSLVTPANHLLTGVSDTGQCVCCVLAANINPQQITACPGATLMFTTPVGTGLCATQWIWQFPGGSPATATGSSATTSYMLNGTYTVTLFAIAGTDTVSQTASVTIITPTIQVIGFNTSLSVCDGTHQNIAFEIIGNMPPYNITICDQNNIPVATMNNVNDDTLIVLVPVSIGSNVFHICSATNGAGCNLDTTGTGSVSFMVEDCCPNLFVNGDFELNTPGCNISPATTQLFTSPGCTTYNVGHYAIGDASLGMGTWPAISGNNGINGQSMYIDGIAAAQVALPVLHTRLWCETITLTQGSLYSVQFDYSPNYGNLYNVNTNMYANTTLHLQIIINNTLINVPIQPLDPSPGSPWETEVFDWVCPFPTGSYQVCLCQVNVPLTGSNFGAGGFDFLIDNLSFRAKDVPIVDAGNDTLLCPGGIAVLGSPANNPGGTYQWLPSTFVNCPGCSLTTANPLNNTTYILTEQFNGCLVSDTVQVNTLNISGNNDTTICGGNPVTLSVNVNQTSGYMVLWQPGGQTTTSITESPLSSTMYVATVSDSLSGCSITDTIFVTVFPGALVNAGANQSICAGDSVQLLGNGNGTFSWSPASGLNNPNIANPLASPSVTTTYTLTVTLTNGCFATDTVQVNVTQCCPLVNGINTADQDRSSQYGISFNNNTPTPVAINGTFYIDNNFNITAFWGADHIRMGPDAKIVIRQNCRLTATASQFQRCDNFMWESIIIEPGGELVMNGCEVYDAKAAVTSLGGAKYTISGTSFFRNYIGLKVEPASGLHPGTIVSSNIEGAVLGYPPYAGVRSRYGIQLTQVDSIVIGAAGPLSNENTIRAVEVGVYALTSKFGMVRNRFLDIIQPTIYIQPGCCAFNTCNDPSICFAPQVGVAVWEVGGRSTIGGTNVATDANRFKNCTNGILIEADATTIIRNNEFQQIESPNPAILSYSIWVRRCKGVFHWITDNSFATSRNGIFYEMNSAMSAFLNNNRFNDFRQNGIYTKQNPNVSFTIQSNQFNTQYTGTPGKYGIRVQNAVIGQNISLAFITGNIIKHVDKGIWLTKAPYSLVTQGNQVEFQAQVPSITSIGIQVQNSEGTLIDANGVLKLGAPPSNDSLLRERLYGISVEYGSFNSNVSNNNLSRVGSGIHFYGTSNYPSTVNCNLLVQNMAGIRMNNSFIGDQGAGISVQNPDGVTHDNLFTFNNASNQKTFFRNNNDPAFNWHCRTITSGSPTTNPDQVITMSPQNAMFMVSAFPDAPQACYYQNPSPQQLQQQELALIALRAYPFDSLNADQLIMADQTAMKQLKDNPSLMSLNTPYDLILMDYYLEQLGESVERTDEVHRLASGGDTLQARIVNDGIVPANCIEASQKTVNTIYLKTWAQGIPNFTPADSALLYMVATENVNNCGTAVYDARVMLDLDLDDFGPDGVHRPVWLNDGNDAKGKMYPNPTSGDALYERELKEHENGFIEIMDLPGHVLLAKSLTIKTEIPASSLTNGIYLYRVYVNGKLVDTGKLTVLH
jgi:hypothetical protein